MVRFTKITVVLLDGTTLQFKYETLNNVAKVCLGRLAKRNPMLIKIDADNKLYFNDTVFNAWLQKEIDGKTLFDKLQVDNLVRNKETFITKTIAIEDDSLWLLKNNKCILADDDLYISAKLDNRFKLAF
tara:strand:- start:38213 stop:38599 length:387 start_codon:yes stop_codon:yes gene_type:complete